MLKKWMSSKPRTALGVLPWALVACSSDDTTFVRQTLEANPPAPAPGVEEPRPSPAPSEATGGDAPSPSAPTESRRLYAIATVVSGPEESNMYLRVLESLEPQEDLDLTRAREFPGWSDVKVSGGKLFVSSGEGPTVTRFSVNERLELVEEGRISFAAYTQDASMYTQQFVSETKAYLAFATNEYVVWNPTTMTITGTITGPEIAPIDGIDPFPAQDRGMVVRGERLYHSINWLDYESYRMTPGSRIVIIDTETDTIVDELEAPCPYLEPGTVDEAGNIYFSNWVFSPMATLVNDQARACAVRIPAGSEELDPDFRLEFAAVTGGHEGAALEYLGRGQALLSVFREDRQPFDREQDDPSEWIFGSNWRFAVVDLEQRSAREIDALGWHSGGYYSTRIEGMTYILVPGTGYGSTELYRLTDSGDVTRILGTNGWSIRVLDLGATNAPR